MNNDQNTIKLKKGSAGFIGGVLALSGGAVIAQGLGVISTPVITRLFMPEAMGIAAIFLSIVSLIGLIGCFTYDLAIILPKSDEDAANILILCFALVFIVSGLVALLILVCGSSIFALFKVPELESVKWFIPIGVFLVSLGGPLRYWNTRHKHFKRLALVRIQSIVVNIVAVLSAGFTGFTAGFHMVIARVFGLAAVPVFLGRFLLGREDLRFFSRACSREKVLELARRYRKFPLVGSWNALLNQASREVPTILIASFFGVGTAGLYSLTRRFMSIPSLLVSHGVGQVFFQRSAAEKANDGDLAYLYENVIERLVSIGLLPMLIIAMTGPKLFGFVLGEKWADAGVYAAILTIWLFFIFIFSPLTVLYNVLERQGLHFFISITLLGGRVAALVVGGLVLRDVIWALLLFSFVGAFFNLLGIFIISRLVKASILTIFKSFVRCFVYAIPSVVIIGGCQWILDMQPVFVLIVLIPASVPYVIFVVRHDEKLRAAFYKVIEKIVSRLR